MDRWKSRGGKSQRGEIEVRRAAKRKSEKKEDAGAGKGRKDTIHCGFPMICGSGGSKSRLAKAAGAEPAGQIRDEKLHAVVARTTFPRQNVHNTSASDHFWKLRCRKCARCCGAKHIFKSVKNWRSRTTFGSGDIEKVHAVVARSTCPSQNVQDTPTSVHFLKLRCRKCARRCGANHISKAKCTKHTTFSALLEAQRLKKCTVLWCEARFQVKRVKKLRGSDHFWKWRCRKCARFCGAKHVSNSKVKKKLRGSDHFWKLRCQKSARHWGAKHISKSKCTKHHTCGPLLTVQMWSCVASARDCEPYQKWAKREVCVAISYTTLHYATLQYTTPQYTTLHSTPLHHTTLHHTTLHYTPLHYATLRYCPPHYIPLRYITLHYATLNCATLHYP